MSDEHNPMRPLFVEVPSIGDDLRAVFEGIVAAAVEKAKPPPRTPRGRSVVDMAAEALSHRRMLGAIGAAAVESWRSPLDLVLHVRARCSTCDRWVNIGIDEMPMVLAGDRGGVMYAISQVVGAMRQHVCNLKIV